MIPSYHPNRAVAERAALVARIADHDADIVAAPLDALRLFAVERLAPLAPQALEGEADGLMPSFISCLPARNESVTS